MNEVGTTRWKQDDFGFGLRFDAFSQRREAGVTIDDQVTGILQESIFAVRQAAADLPHPHSIGARRDSGDMHSSRLQMHHGENIERDESAPCPDFHSREVCGKDRIPVSLQKCAPGL